MAQLCSTNVTVTIFVKVTQPLNEILGSVGASSFWDLLQQHYLNNKTHQKNYILGKLARTLQRTPFRLVCIDECTFSRRIRWGFVRAPWARPQFGPHGFCRRPDYQTAGKPPGILQININHKNQHTKHLKQPSTEDKLSLVGGSYKYMITDWITFIDWFKESDSPP